MERIYLPKNMQIEMELIHYLAWSFHKTTGIDFQELKSQAALSYCEARLNFINKEIPVKFTTYAYSIICNNLISFCKIEKRYVLDQFVDFDCVTEPTPFFELRDSLPEDCKVITDLLLENRDRIAGLVPKAARGEVAQILREQGWSWPNIWKGIRNFKNALNEIPENCIIY